MSDPAGGLRTGGEVIVTLDEGVKFVRFSTPIKVELLVWSKSTRIACPLTGLPVNGTRVGIRSSSCQSARFPETHVELFLD